MEAQGRPAQPQTSVGDELRSLAVRAAVVFSGQVVSIVRLGGVMEINFRVEQQVLGAVGGTYTLCEWAGLWPPGQFRYTVGQRALVFLHGTSAAGFASPVNGSEGVVPVVVQGANAPALLDVRRLAASIQRIPGTPLPTEAQGAMEMADALQMIQGVLAPASASLPRPVPEPIWKPIWRPLPVRGAPVMAPALLTEPNEPVRTGAPMLKGASLQSGRREVLVGSR